MTGRRKTAPEIKDVTGARQRQNAPAAQSLIPAEAPPMPAYIEESLQLRAVWIEVVTDLDRLNRLNRTDSGTVEAYVINLERVRRLQAKVLKEGESYAVDTDNGRRYFKHPDMDTLLKSMQQLKGLAIEMGCTPASRGNVPNLINGDLFEGRENNRFAKFNA